MKLNIIIQNFIHLLDKNSCITKGFHIIELHYLKFQLEQSKALSQNPTIEYLSI